MTGNSTHCFTKELGSDRKKLTECSQCDTNQMLSEQDNTENQYSGYIICIFASIEYAGLSAANMQE